MLLCENYTAEHILRLRKETGEDPSIQERTIFAFGLLEAMLPVSCKFERTGIGSDREAKEATNTAFNFTTSDNNVTIKFCSSAKDKCKANNILSNERKSLWVSEQGVPQTIILNSTKMKKNPKGLFKYWGIYCWHAFSTNPKKIEIDATGDTCVPSTTPCTGSP